MRNATRLDRTRSLVLAGRYTEAADEIQIVTKLVKNLGDIYDAACTLSLACSSVAKDLKFTPTDQKMRVEEYGAMAVGLLKRIQKQGYFKDPTRIEEMKKDVDLEALRERDDFQELQKELEKKP
jgi:hypothetical protein